MARLLTLALLVTASLGCTPQESDTFEIETSKGTMVVRLYDETPLHGDNFRKLVEEGFYDRTLFHRTIQNFMIQGGDPNSLDGNPANNGTGGPGYTVPAEFRPELFHRKGALAAARQPDQVNPERASSGSQFYIVHGRVWTEEELVQYEQSASQQLGRTVQIPADQREVYKTIGGVPWLDGNYTVFGEVIEGLEVVDSIAASETPNMLGQQASPALGDQPIEPVPMFIRPSGGQ